MTSSFNVKLEERRRLIPLIQELYDKDNNITLLKMGELLNEPPTHLARVIKNMKIDLKMSDYEKNIFAYRVSLYVEKHPTLTRKQIESKFKVALTTLEKWNTNVDVYPKNNKYNRINEDTLKVIQIVLDSRNGIFSDDFYSMIKNSTGVVKSTVNNYFNEGKLKGKTREQAKEFIDNQNINRIKEYLDYSNSNELISLTKLGRDLKLDPQVVKRLMETKDLEFYRDLTYAYGKEDIKERRKRVLEYFLNRDEDWDKSKKQVAEELGISYGAFNLDMKTDELKEYNELFEIRAMNRLETVKPIELINTIVLENLKNQTEVINYYKTSSLTLRNYLEENQIDFKVKGLLKLNRESEKKNNKK